MIFRTYRSRLIGYGLILLIFLISFQIYSYNNAQETVVAEAERSLTRTAQLFDAHLRAERQEIERLATVLRDDKRIQEYLFVAIKFDSGYEALQTQYKKHFGWLPVDKTLIFNVKGEIVLGNIYQQLANIIRKKQLISEKSTVYLELNNQLILLSSIPFEYKGEKLGFIVVTRTLNQKWLHNKTQNNIGQLIIEKNGIVQLSTLPDYQTKKYQPINGQIEYNNQSYRIFPIALTKLHSGATRLWFGADVSDMVKRLKLHRRNALSQAVIGCLVLIFLGWLFSRNFDRPLAQLASLAREISQGRLPDIEKSQASTEIGVLRNQFVDMVHALQLKDQQVKEIHAKLENTAITDALTGLFNRHAFEETLNKVVINAKLGKKQHALCYLDLDQFKVVNDTCGHAAGDELLKQLSDLLNSRVRGTDVLARLGGDEFGLIMSNINEVQAQKCAEEIVQLVKDYKFVWQGKLFGIGVSIGLVILDNHCGSDADVMRHADIACYAAKNSGRNRVNIYRDREDGSVQLVEEINWVQKLQDALDNNRFQLWYQPIVPARSKQSVEHGEILIRLIEPNGKIIAPGAFIPAAERYQLMPEIDKWVFARTLEYTKERLKNSEQFVFSMNLSGLTLNDPNMLDHFKQVLEKENLPKNIICFEITETAAIHNFANALTFVTELKKMGCTFALDDFGAGLSTFHHFRKLPIDYIKIDGSFISNIVENRIDEGMVKAINEIAHLMKKATIAEFVSDNAIHQRVADLGIDYVQGYAIGKPMPLDQYISENNSLTISKTSSAKS